MNKRTITQLMILVTAIVWVVWDIWVYIEFGNPSTISATLWRYSYNIPGVPFIAGLLVGHIFFQMREPTAFDDSGGLN